MKELNHTLSILNQISDCEFTKMVFTIFKELTTIIKPTSTINFKQHKIELLKCPGPK